MNGTIAYLSGPSPAENKKLRYFNAAGCDPYAEIGEARDPEIRFLNLGTENGFSVREIIDAAKVVMNPEHQPPAPFRKPISKTAVNPADTVRLPQIMRRS